MGSFPAANGSGWNAMAIESEPHPGPWKIVAYAICAKVAP
jgi:hypothetical protein